MRATNKVGTVAAIIVCGALGCKSSSNSQPSLSWWKKDPAAAGSTATTQPQLPSVGATPPVISPGTVSATAPSTPSATATYPERTAGATGSYPTTPYPSTNSIPSSYTNATATPASYGGAMPPATSGAMTPQAGPYSSVYGADGASAGAASPNAGYTNTVAPSYPSTNSYSGATSTPPAASYSVNATTVQNQYAEPAAGSRYGSAGTTSYGGSTPDAGAATPATDTTSAASSGGSRYGSRYDAPADTTSAAATTGAARYSASPEPTATTPAANDPYIRGASPGSNYQPGNIGYTPGNTGYDPGNTGYNPPGVPPYPSTAATPSAPPTTRRDPFYRPGGTSDYRPLASSSTAPAGGTINGGSYTSAPAGIRPSYEANPYSAPPATPANPADRYGNRGDYAPPSRY